MKTAKTIPVEVERFQPEHGAGHLDSYEIECDTPVTVLGLLKHIYLHFDSTLAFRWSCGLGKCGACGVSVNGKPVLACCEPVTEAKLVIKPLKNFPVVRDLIVDRKPYYELKQKAENAWVSCQQAAEFNRQSFAGCIECLCCMSVCPVLSKHREHFVGPAVLAAMLRQGIIPAEAGQIIPGKGCIACGKCSDACGKGIDVAGLLDGKR